MLDEQTYYKKVGLNIAKLREDRKITQEELGRSLKLSRVSIVNIEKGKQRPSIYLLYLISIQFNVPLVNLYIEQNANEDLEVLGGKEFLTDKDFDDINRFAKGEDGKIA